MPRKRSQGRRAPRQQVDNTRDEATGEEAIDVNDAPTRASVSPELDRNYTNRSVERVITMLNLMQESVEGLSLAEISSTIDLAKPTTFRYLWTLEAAEWVERDPNGQYRLGLGFVGMQSRALTILQERARPWLESLRNDTGETANLGVLTGKNVVYVETVPSHRDVRMSRDEGSRDPLHCTALGKAIASLQPEARVREILERTDLSARTTNTITTIDDYLDDLTKVRRRGYAIDDRENDIDGRCVAVAVHGTNIPAALSISGPASRFTMKHIEQAAALLINAANHLGRKEAS
ncbi:IclR family transcriptional regulator [Phytoactinopolyspora mesophila]|uniref:Helix-turn-helix domain-containing protein n=1 Tax=Phytoactinopolyspora mesophila TaxID=2650750 RepID=A0A7K3MDF3_9ACTN|nr:IclR family transcriptional regulator [Phytoactinopolyspora mesophila]NDL61087.1 helix-turn-helix domain-containing protein [Phytoactinopolyspora mesophila]